MNKIGWLGRIVSIQPRIRLMRSFDERSHNYLGYVLQVEGIIGDEPGKFRIAVGKAAPAQSVSGPWTLWSWLKGWSGNRIRRKVWTNYNPSYL